MIISWPVDAHLLKRERKAREREMREGEGGAGSPMKEDFSLFYYCIFSTLPQTDSGADRPSHKSHHGAVELK